MPEVPAAASSVVAGRRASIAWFPLAVVAAAWLAHAPVLRHGWVLDDVPVVRDHPAVARGVAGLGQAFALDAWRGDVEAGPWRPLTLASFAVEAPLWRDTEGRPSPFGFHLTNLCLHSLASVLLFLFVRRLAPSRPLFALGAALVFAVHPLHAGAVSLLVGRADLLALCFSLATVLLWERISRGSRGLLPLLPLLWFLALLSKEVALGLPLALVLLDLARGGRARLLENGVAYAALLVALPLRLLLAPLPSPGLTEGTLAGLAGIARITLGFVLPVGLARDRIAEARTEEGISAPELLGLAVVLAALGACLAGRRHGSPIVLALSLGLFVVLALPAAWVSPSGAPLESSFAYATAFGLFGLAGLALEVLLSGAGARRAAGAAGVALLLLSLGYLTWRESDAYADELSYHRSLIAREPRDPQRIVRLGQRLRQEAVLDLARSASLPAETAPQRRALGRARKALDEAVQWLAQATQLPQGRRDADAWWEYGIVLSVRAETARARLTLRHAMGIEPHAHSAPEDVPAARRFHLSEGYEHLGRAEEALGDAAAASDAYLTAVRLAPERIEVLRRAGLSLVRAGRPGEGIPVLEEALGQTRDAETQAAIFRELDEARQAARKVAEEHVRRARGLEEAAEHRQAAEAYEEAIAVEPHRWEAYERAIYLRGIFLGDYRSAFALLEQAEAVLARYRVAEDAPIRATLRRSRRDLEEALAQAEREEGEDEGPGGG